MSNKIYIIELTEPEFDCIQLLIRNGWGDGDFKGWGGQNPKTQTRAMNKIINAQPTYKKKKK